MAKKKIGFVGTGKMGANMARRLKDRGYRISAIYDVRKDIAQALGEELNSISCDKLSQVTAASDVVITVVTDDTSMKKIYMGKKDSLLTDAAGKIFINCATVSPRTHIDVEKAAKKAKAASLEGCMASSITQARDGTLYLMVGGEKSTFNRVRNILGELSQEIRYIGKSGKAAEVKALVNMVMNINTAGLAEGLGLGQALGLNLDMLREVFSQTGANSRVLETDGEDMQIRDHDCYFSAAHAAKDSSIAGTLAKKAKIKLPLNDATVSQYRLMIAEGLGELDKSGVAEFTFKNRHFAKRKKS
ncbi:MAG: 2-hydroxy-3-oxopropionate reductase [Candidatus Moanabacter tarae]|uniref:2-hydroxy-3-oxopropionate reductase n=1 Tax=Candidatus Moanibacter tarae TaxID=2200854 RepID=A0A2Z4AGX6_9BACT|nr:MAG: 2-hydroxy-3-oxopropionate reductase [Candidatus Moanabacter tarae]|tara:strand:+ start:10663 stop:11568 length:906 start_codon:yes stop_codon:yes gene_type:complete